MKKVILSIAKSRPVLVVILVVLSPLLIPYVTFGLLAKEKLTTDENVTLFFLLVLYLGFAIAIHFAGCSWDQVFWVVFVLVAIAGVTEEIVRDRRDNGEDKG